MNWIRTIGLQRRIMLYVTFGLVSLVILFAYIALNAVNTSRDAILDERLVLAQTVAKDIDSLVLGSLSQMERTASLILADPLQDLSPHEASMLGAMTIGLGGYAGSMGSPAHVYLTDTSGRPVWEWNSPELLDFPEKILAAFTPAVYRGDTVVKGLSLDEGPVPSAITIGVPVLGADGLVKGALTASLATNPSNHALFIPSASRLGDYRLELIDDQGVVVASSESEDVLQPSRHQSVEGGPLQRSSEGVWAHDSSQDDVADHVVALVPLQTVPWTVALEQDKDVALALPLSLKRRIYLLAGLAIPAGLVLAWVTTGQVVRPLTLLTGTAGRIASADLDSPVIVEGQDEVRTLASSLEVMRQRLRRSLYDIESWNQQLESRVRDRTVELERHDEERAQLLQKVITAQEDERKRVARELHDTVGRALTGLGMALGSVEGDVNGSDERIQQRLATLRSMTTATIEDARCLIADFRPSLLDDLGLVDWSAEARAGRWPALYLPK